MNSQCKIWYLLSIIQSGYLVDFVDFGIFGRLGIVGRLGRLGIVGIFGRLGRLGRLCIFGRFGILGRLGRLISHTIVYDSIRFELRTIHHSIENTMVSSMRFQLTCKFV